MAAINADILSSSANSYVTVAAAAETAALLISDARLVVWTALSSTLKESYLMRATKLLDVYFTWTGYRLVLTQPLGWPRGYAYSVDGMELLTTAFPQKVVDATVLQAILLSEGVTTESSSEAPLSQLKVGPIELKFDQTKSAAVASSVALDVIDILRPIGEFIGSTTGARMAPLIRV